MRTIFVTQCWHGDLRLLFRWNVERFLQPTKAIPESSPPLLCNLFHDLPPSPTPFCKPPKDKPPTKVLKDNRVKKVSKTKDIRKQLVAKAWKVTWCHGPFKIVAGWSGLKRSTRNYLQQIIHLSFLQTEGTFLWNPLQKSQYSLFIRKLSPPCSMGSDGDLTPPPNMGMHVTSNTSIFSENFINSVPFASQRQSGVLPQRRSLRHNQFWIHAESTRSSQPTHTTLFSIPVSNQRQCRQSFINTSPLLRCMCLTEINTL